MALNIFTDAAATAQASPTEYFVGDGLASTFTLTKFTGSTTSAVYRESRTTIAAVVVASGIITTSGLVASALIGMAAYHQVGAGAEHVFRGYVTANSTTQITLSDLTYSAGADNLILVTYNKLSAVNDYSITGQTLTLTAGAPASGINIYAVGASPVNVDFGGDVAAGTPVETAVKLYLKRDPAYAYSTIQISSDNLSQTAQSSAWVDAVAATSGADTTITLAGADVFPGVNSEVGKAVNKGADFIGIVTSNTTTVATIAGVTGVTGTATHTFYTVGELWLANDNSGSAGTYRKVLQGGMDSGYAAPIPASINANTVYAFWVKGTIPIPAAATNYAENVIKISATEYLA